MTIFDEEIQNSISELNIEKITQRARELYAAGDLKQAKILYGVLSNVDSNDITSRAIYAELISDGQAINVLKSRDMLLAIFNDFPHILINKSQEALILFRLAAERCRYIGPLNKSIELYKLICEITNNADDYFQLHVALNEDDQIEESIHYLRKAVETDQAKYGTHQNLEILVSAEKKSTSENSDFREKKQRLNRYPAQNDFLGNLVDLIKNHIAYDLKNTEKFLTKDTKIFTMGSCFARNIAGALRKNGYIARNLEITEELNTTYANLEFINWLESKQGINHERIENLIQSSNDNANRNDLLKAIASTDVFILTLGVALAFFDKHSGDFVLPPASSLSQYSMKNKYIYRETTVSENVGNVLKVIHFIKNLSPNIKIILTVSPVPLMVSLSHKSCVQADCISKSTMRLVANEIVNNSTVGAIYWPSFEAIRWAGSNASGFFGAEDNLSVHVSENKVDRIIDAFIETFRN